MPSQTPAALGCAVPRNLVWSERSGHRARTRGQSTTCPGEAGHCSLPQRHQPDSGRAARRALLRRTGRRAVQPRPPAPPPAGRTAAPRGAAAPGSGRASDSAGSGAAPPRYAEPSGGRRRCHSLSPRPRLDRGFCGSATASERRLSAQLSPRRAPLRCAARPGCAPRRSPPLTPAHAGEDKHTKAPQTRPNRRFSSFLPTCPAPGDPAPPAPRRALPAPPRWR